MTVVNVITNQLSFIRYQKKLKLTKALILSKNQMNETQISLLADALHQVFKQHSSDCVWKEANAQKMP